MGDLISLPQNPRETIKRIGEFLGKTLTDAQSEKIRRHCQFNEMRNNKMVNYSWWAELGITTQDNNTFMRKGLYNVIKTSMFSSLQ